MKPGISILLFNLIRLLFPRVDLLEVGFFLHAAGPKAPAQAETRPPHQGRGSLDQGQKPVSKVAGNTNSPSWPVSQ